MKKISTASAIILITLTLQFPNVLQSQQSCANLVDGGVYYIVNRKDNQAMDVYNQSAFPGAPIKTYIGFIGQPNQLFYIKVISNITNRFMLLTYDNGLAMDLSTGNALQQLPTCSGMQIFTTVEVEYSFSSCFIRSDPDGPKLRVLDDFVSATELTGAIDQQWVFHQIPLRCGNLVDNGIYYICNTISGNVMDVTSESPTEGSQLQVSALFKNRTNQLFYIKIVPSRPNTFMILNVGSNLAVDLTSGSGMLQTPTCSEEQLFLSIPRENDACFIFRSPMEDYVTLNSLNGFVSAKYTWTWHTLKWTFEAYTENGTWSLFTPICLNDIKSNKRVVTCKTNKTMKNAAVVITHVFCVAIIFVITVTV